LIVFEAVQKRKEYRPRIPMGIVYLPAFSSRSVFQIYAATSNI